MSNVEKCLLGIERHQDIVPGRIAEITNQVVIVGFERLKNLRAQCLRGLMAFVMQGEMHALTLRELRLGILLTLGFR